jgi:type I restriction enzyme, R subunit
MIGAHTEQAFESFIASQLVDHGGYQQGDPETYDRDRALLPAELFAFIQATQPKVWERLREIHHEKLEAVLLEGLCKALEQEGSLWVLRHGFKFYGQTIRLAYFAPSHGLNPQVQALYDANRLTVVRQVKYDPKNDNSIDLVLFLNGIPIVTAELKNQMTGQSAVVHARNQYKRDRDENAPIFKFKRRALVHFAVDPDEVWMTTHLKGSSTFFLPFNRGHAGGKGNQPVEGKHRTHYLWDEVWQRDSVLDIIGRFMHLQKESKTDPTTGAKWTTETMIFPRYHQLDAVRKLVAGARAKGAGTNYLVQHSAGSGKSNTIAWVAHRLASLHDEQDRKVYDSVIVLTDRVLLDRQLQDTIYQFEHKQGVVEKIDKDSGQLAKALGSGVPIVISTMHKFGFIQDKIASLPERRYAVIVDEAHSSQSGEMAVKVKEVLS